LLYLAPADYFLFLTVKEELAGIVLTPENTKKIWKGVIRNGIDDFVLAFR
jgi:hypothetical protein